MSFSIEPGETFGLVGESGSGKTTTGRCILRLIEPTSGEVRFRDRDVLALSRADCGAPGATCRSSSRIRTRRSTRGCGRAPSSRNRWSIHQLGTKAERRERVAELFRLVGLDPAHLDRYPHEFSGGQRQRIGLARALALNPSLIVADEPVSALDVSVQAQVINLLMDLQERLALTYLFIAHDLRLVRHVCARVAVMYRGGSSRSGRTEALFRNPAHPYTRALLSAIPVPDPDARPQRIPWNPDGDGPDAAAAGGRDRTRGRDLSRLAAGDLRPAA